MPSTTSYEHAVKMPTAGFYSDAIQIDRANKKDGAEFFEPSPIIIGNKGEGLAWLTGLINVGLHLACLVTTCIAGIAYLGTSGKKTQYHEQDYVDSITWVYLICEIVAVLWTLGWFAFVQRAQEFAPAAHLGLGLQLLSTVSATLLSYWVMMAPKTLSVETADFDTTGLNADRRPASMDNAVILSMYFGWLVVAGYIMTPISGVYLKTK